MLSPQDIHYLSGLLQISTRGRAVVVELGSMIYDAAAESERDVDVTVRYDAKGGPAVLIGIEVKAERRPLDVIRVEQLVQKLADMPSITEGGIVSASGFTAPAVRKARAHGVALFHFKEWDTATRPFWADMARLESICERCLFWENAIVEFGDDVHQNPEIDAALSANAFITGEDGAPIEGVADVKALLDLIGRETRRELARRPEVAGLKAGTRLPQRIALELEDRPHLQVSTTRVPLARAIIGGNLYWDERRYPVIFRQLVDVTNGEHPLIGCALAAMSSGEIYGVSSTNLASEGHLSVVHVSAADRLKAKPRRQLLSRG